MVYTAKVWLAAAPSCNGLREASALMRISSNYYYPAHAQRMRRSVTDIYIYIYIYIPIARA